MAKTILDLTSQEKLQYHTGKVLERREKANSRSIELRKKRAWSVAGKAAQLLREDFAAQKVLIVGSLSHGKLFDLWSDIDLAAGGIAPEKFYSAVAAVTGLTRQFKIDLVDIEECSPALRKVIEKEGIEI